MRLVVYIIDAMEQPIASLNQLKLYKLLTEFAFDAVISIIRIFDKEYGAIVWRGDAVALAAPLLEKYFNEVVHEAQNDKDPRILAMLDIDVGKKFHSTDLVQLAMMLGMSGLKTLGGTVKSLPEFECGVKEFIVQNMWRAAHLCGCDHAHETIRPDENVFTFNIASVDI